MHWRVRSFFVDSQAEDYLNSVAIDPTQVREIHPIVQGPRSGIRVVCCLTDEQAHADEQWLSRQKTDRAAQTTPRSDSA